MKKFFLANKFWILYILAAFCICLVSIIQIIYYSIKTDREIEITKAESRMNVINSFIGSVCLDYQDLDTRTYCVDRMINKAKELEDKE